MPAAHDASAFSDGTMRPFAGDGPEEGAATGPAAGVVGAWPSIGGAERAAANGAVGAETGPDGDRAVPSGSGARPRVPSVGPRLSETGSPSFRAWASCLTLGDLEGALRKAVA